MVYRAKNVTDSLQIVVTRKNPHYYIDIYVCTTRPADIHGGSKR